MDFFLLAHGMPNLSEWGGQNNGRRSLLGDLHRNAFIINIVGIMKSQRQRSVRTKDPSTLWRTKLKDKGSSG